MREIFVVVRETTPAGCGIPIEAYSSAEDASERVMALRETHKQDHYGYTMVALDAKTPHPFRVTFNTSSMEWGATPIPEPAPGRHYHAPIQPRPHHEEATTYWQWRAVYAIDRAEAIEKCKEYARILFRSNTKESST